MQDLTDIGVLDFDFVEEAVIKELLAQRENARIRNIEHKRLDLNTLTQSECKARFRFERDRIERIAAALEIPNRIETENGYVVSGKLN